MLKQDALDLGRRDPLARDLEHIIRPTAVGKIAGFVLGIGIAGVHPVAQHGLGRLLGIVPVRGGPGLAPNQQATHLADSHRLPAFIYNFGLIAGNRASAGAGPVIVQTVGNKNMQHFGRANSVQNRQAGVLLPAPEHFGRQGLAGRDTGA